MAAILIVDDEKTIRDHLALFIQSLGHAVQTAADAKAALELLSREEFDVVLSDVRLVGTDGLMLLRKIRAQHPGATVVLMTGYATVPQAVEAMRAGAYEYLTKPLSPDDVRLLINHVLEVQALRRENAAVRRAAHLMDTAPVRDEAPCDVETRAADGDLSLKDLERRRIEQVLSESPTLSVAAARLGIDPATLWRKRKRYRLE